MDPFPFYALPDDALGCILRMALAANGSTMQARRDLSLLCRRWRDSLRDAPLNKHVIFEKRLTDKRLLAVLSSGCFTSVRLTHSVYGQWPPLPILPPLIVRKLAKRSAPTLTALHDLPLVEDRWSRDEPRPGDPVLQLAPLTQLCALTLRQTWYGPAELRAKELPPGLEDLTLVMDRAGNVGADWEPPRLVAFDRLRNLRRITCVEYRSWSIWRRRESWWQLTPLPHSLEVLRLEHGQKIDLCFISSLACAAPDVEEQRRCVQQIAGRSPHGPAGLTLEVCSNVVVFRLIAGGGLVAWEGCTTALPQGFTALHLETSGLSCIVAKRLAYLVSEAQSTCTIDAVHLLCRALRLAPACYRRFSLSAHPLEGPRTQLKVMGTLLAEPGSLTHTYVREEFDGVAGLAAAMGDFAGVEGLNVQLSQDGSCIIVRRSGNEQSGVAAGVQ